MIANSMKDKINIISDRSDYLSMALIFLKSFVEFDGKFLVGMTFLVRFRSVQVAFFRVFCGTDR